MLNHCKLHWPLFQLNLFAAVRIFLAKPFLFLFLSYIFNINQRNFSPNIEIHNVHSHRVHQQLHKHSWIFALNLFLWEDYLDLLYSDYLAAHLVGFYKSIFALSLLMDAIMIETVVLMMISAFFAFKGLSLCFYVCWKEINKYYDCFSIVELILMMNFS